MRTETLAIVFTDIKGYTAATSAQTHRENARMLRRIERIVAPVVRGYGGRVVKSIGDAYMIVFRSPTEAVRCAVAIQDRLHQRNAATRADHAIHLRVAMNVGEVRVHRGDVFGEPVNIAARLEALTPADEIYLSEAVYLTMNRSQLGTERVGDFELKGIPEPITVYRARKLAAGEEAAADGMVPGSALPFGGTELEHWRRMLWLRRAYGALWALVLVGLVGAGYLRYRPSTDYGELLARAKDAVDEQQAVEAIALLRQIPEEASQDRQRARRIRHQAVAQLLAGGNLDVARTEIEALLDEDGRDPEALLLQGTLLARKGKDLKAAVSAVAAALKLNAALASRPETLATVVQAYRDPSARRTAESVVDTYLKQSAVSALAAALDDASFDYKTRVAIALRLERLGAGHEVDWVALALEELKSSSCQTRKNAIARLVAESDERAVGPLMKVAEANGCGAAQARKAVDAILGR